MPCRSSARPVRAATRELEITYPERRQVRLYIVPLDAPLDFAEIVQIIAEPCAVARAQPALKATSFVDNGIENAALLFDARTPISCRSRRTEELLEHGARIDLHG